jgi:hypothetical protein
MALRTSHGHDSSSLRPHALGNMHAPLLLSKQMCNRPFCVLLALPVRQDADAERENGMWRRLRTCCCLQR